MKSGFTEFNIPLIFDGKNCIDGSLRFIGSTIGCGGGGPNGCPISIGGGSKFVDGCCLTMGNGPSGGFSPGMVSSGPVCAACCSRCAFDA